MTAELEPGLQVDATDTFRAMFGYSWEEALGHTDPPTRSLAPRQERGRVVQPCRHRDNSPEIEALTRTKSGEFWAALASVEMADMVEIAVGRFVLALLEEARQHRFDGEARSAAGESNDSTTENASTRAATDVNEIEKDGAFLRMWGDGPWEAPSSALGVCPHCGKTSPEGTALCIFCVHSLQSGEEVPEVTYRREKINSAGRWSSPNR